MSKGKTRWRNGYDDGSGKGTVTFDDQDVIRVHWGCGCCDSFDLYNPSKEDKKKIRFADRLVKLLNESGIRPPIEEAS